MIYKKKSWQEKIANKNNFPKVAKLEKKFPCYNFLQKMGVREGEEVILVNSEEILDLMKKIPEGKLITIVEICKKIAKENNVKGCCSLTTGISIMAIANAVEEAAKENKNLNVPYWRTLKSDGFLNEKYPGGIEAQRKMLENEGFKILQKGKKCYVENYRMYLHNLDG
jgi:alkylated DNA nucleotide flippase Atl1